MQFVVDLVEVQHELLDGVDAAGHVLQQIRPERIKRLNDVFLTLERS